MSAAALGELRVRQLRSRVSGTRQNTNPNLPLPWTTRPSSSRRSGACCRGAGNFGGIGWHLSPVGLLPTQPGTNPTSPGR